MVLHTSVDQRREALMLPSRRLIVLTSLVIGSLASAMPVAASADDSFSFAVGGGHLGLSLMNPTAQGPPFALSAHLGPPGAFGEYNSNANNGGVLDFRGDVTFLIVSVNTALICDGVRRAAVTAGAATGV